MRLRGGRGTTAHAIPTARLLLCACARQVVKIMTTFFESEEDVEERGPGADGGVEQMGHQMLNLAFS